jgi:hypothetical protein
MEARLSEGRPHLYRFSSNLFFRKRAADSAARFFRDRNYRCKRNTGWFTGVILHGAAITTLSPFPVPALFFAFWTRIKPGRRT